MNELFSLRPQGTSSLQSTQPARTSEQRHHTWPAYRPKGADNTAAMRSLSPPAIEPAAVSSHGKGRGRGGASRSRRLAECVGDAQFVTWLAWSRGWPGPGSRVRVGA
ncbi:hypothetical protein SKAU_G00266480 [Synaphobranchus kaupii]|uniref:Uncharacterized protein n=1 Tax=Synaphobranchus kaupii TaxID=118154 RepID=A0A9Q1IQ67_SYNKA|nr:hypothetical protein SKAU_G00266480 [Synaphobranchus kaupii]